MRIYDALFEAQVSSLQANCFFFLVFFSGFQEQFDAVIKLQTFLFKVCWSSKKLVTQH